MLASTNSSTAASVCRSIKYLRRVLVQMRHTLPSQPAHGGVQPGEAGRTAVLRLPHACITSLYCNTDGVLCAPLGPELRCGMTTSAGTAACHWASRGTRMASCTAEAAECRDRCRQPDAPLREGRPLNAGRLGALCIPVARQQAYWVLTPPRQALIKARSRNNLVTFCVLYAAACRGLAADGPHTHTQTLSPEISPVARQVHQVPVAVDQEVVDACRLACARVTGLAVTPEVQTAAPSSLALPPLPHQSP
jgi:hypothetical protein